MKKQFPSREEKRAMILNSHQIKSGDTITHSDAARICGLNVVQATNLLTAMKGDGLLRKAVVMIAGHPAALYSRPSKRFASMPWRTISNESLGLVAPL